MTSRLARWLFRRFVGPRIIGYIWLPGRLPVDVQMMLPDEVEVVFRG